MAQLCDVIAYICSQYPNKDELSKARLTKMVYLADWRAAILYERQITEIVWEFNHFGPYVDDVVCLARCEDAFEVVEATNIYGNPKEIIRLQGPASWPSLLDADVAVLDHVIRSASTKTWNEFINLVYSTYPIMTKERYETLNLVQLAQEYKKQQAQATI
jgi:hypothetical protein